MINAEACRKEKRSEWVDMEKELLFAKTLEYIKGIAKDQGHVVSREQVETAFEPLDFGPEQMEMVYDYLRKQKIGI